MIVALQVIFALVFPAIANWLAARNKVARALGPVVLCYGAGITFGNLGLPLETDVSIGLSTAAVPFAIPLLLYSSEVRKWLSLARPLLISFSLACVSAVSAAGIIGFIFKSRTDEWWKIAGMLVGVYVGGTANMSAVGIALDVRKETFLLVSTSDLVTGGVYLLFLLSLGQRLLLKVLPPFKPEDGAHEHVEVPAGNGFTKANAVPILKAAALTLAIVGTSVGLSFLFFSRLDSPFVLVTLTTLGIAASLSPKVRNLAGAYDLGEYSLFVFCVAVGSMADVSQLAGTSPVIFLDVLLTMCLAVALHVIASRFLKLDADTTIICSTATIFGPAFIGPVASAMKNRQLVGPGLTLGLAGIALGTYFGLFTAWALRALGNG
jgi:uncharacterized membrane protein